MYSLLWYTRIKVEKVTPDNWILKKANPLYPVPTIPDRPRCEALIRKLRL